MLKDYRKSEPFFEYGPKCYMYGKTLLKMAKGLERLAKKYKVDVVLDIPDTEIYNIAHHVDTKRVHVYSQHIHTERRRVFCFIQRLQGKRKEDNGDI